MPLIWIVGNVLGIASFIPLMNVDDISIWLYIIVGIGIFIEVTFITLVFLKAKNMGKLPLLKSISSRS